MSLSEKSRTHIPYRNSMMTSVLRDSLGGNCMTTMVATLSAEVKNIDVSNSTADLSTTKKVSHLIETLTVLIMKVSF